MFTKKHLTAMGFLLATSVFANDVEIVKVILTKQSGTWRADVTLNHADTGWEHYADAWRLVDEMGNEIGLRTLYHPHVNEQPFTRSLSNLHIGDDKKIIFIEAHDKEHGWSPNKVKVDMSQSSGAKYQINIR
ncbi:MAG: hypothetical protein OEW99_03290 [Gammaproteobacteria bacterium]|nr:hypothetical protein [Gammaproteobacteria bacterium]